jgi:hypothetical protein
MLLNEFLKEHRKNDEQQATIARLEKRIDALTAGLQKVSAQLELSKPAPQTVLNYIDRLLRQRDSPILQWLQSRYKKKGARQLVRPTSVPL